MSLYLESIRRSVNGQIPKQQTKTNGNKPAQSLLIGLEAIEAIAIRLEAVAIRLEAITNRSDAIAIRLEATASRLEVIAIRLEAIAIRMEAIAIRLEAIARPTTVYTAPRFTPTTVYIHEATVYTNHRLHQTLVYTNHRLHQSKGLYQPPLTPNHVFTQTNVYTKPRCTCPYLEVNVWIPPSHHLPAFLPFVSPSSQVS